MIDLEEIRYMKEEPKFLNVHVQLVTDKGVKLCTSEFSCSDYLKLKPVGMDMFEDILTRMLEEIDTQDPAICEYSGLRPVEGYKEEEVIKEFDKPLIVDLDTEEGEKLAEAYKRGYADGYHEGVYDGQYK